MNMEQQKQVARLLQEERRHEDRQLASGATPAQRVQIAAQRKRRFSLWAALGNSISESAATGGDVLTPYGG